MYVVGYDIAQARRRRPVMRCLRAVTPCWQQSFFAFDGQDREQALTLYAELAQWLDERSDGLLMAAVSPPAPGQGMPASIATPGSGIYLLG